MSASQQQGDRRILLLVDDEPDNLEPMSMLLEADYRVLTAPNGEAALALLQTQPADVIIADQRMPGMTGVELLTRIKTRYPEIVRLILTAYTDFDAMLEAINEGRVYRYIIKPWDPADMAVTIRQALDYKDLHLTQGQRCAELMEANEALVRRNQQLERDVSATPELRHLSAIADRLGRLATDTAADPGVAPGDPIQATTVSTDIAALIDEAVGACSRLLEGSSRNIRLHVDEVPDWVVDRPRLQRLLIQLLREATRAGGSSADIGVTARVEPERLVLSVTDGSPGENSPLAPTPRISRELDALPGGTISYNQSAGQGATITVQLPRRSPVEEVLP